MTLPRLASGASGLAIVLISGLNDHLAEARTPPHARAAFSSGFQAPLPPPRPAELKPSEAKRPAVTPSVSAPLPAPLPETAASTDPACPRVLASEKLVASSIPPISGPEGCGIANPIRLSAIVLADGTHVPVEPPATIRCTLGEALGDWVRDDIVPLALKAGGGLTKIIGSEGYECRPRNRVAGAKLSEHGLGNAYDISGFVLHDGHPLLIANQSEARAFMEQVKATSCARFMTVLGPGSDGFHETHLHVDLTERHNKYRLCQWEVK